MKLLKSTVLMHLVSKQLVLTVPQLGKRGDVWVHLLTYGDCKAPCRVSFVCSDGEVALRKGMNSRSPRWVGSSFLAAEAGRQPDPAHCRVLAPCFLKSYL